VPRANDHHPETQRAAAATRAAPIGRETLQGFALPAGNRKGRDIVRNALQEAAAAGLNVLRTFAHSTDPAFPFQARDTPRHRNEGALSGCQTGNACPVLVAK
jgi:hypothetical protein